MHQVLPSREYGPRSLAPRIVPISMHIRRLLALVLIESYLTWFSLCVHPFARAGVSLWPSQLHSVTAHLTSPAALGALRVFLSTLAHMLSLHLTLVLGCTIVQTIWRRRMNSTMYWDMYAWHLPSVAMLYASLSTVFLLVLRVIWASKEPVNLGLDSRSRSAINNQAGQLLPMHLTQITSAWNPLAERTGLTEWIIRHIMGGMSAGVALAGMYDSFAPANPSLYLSLLCSLARSNPHADLAVLPMHPIFGAIVILCGLSVQAFVREQLGMPWDATFLSWDATSRYCHA